MTSNKSSTLAGLSLDGLLAEGLEKPLSPSAGPWTPPKPEELVGLFPRHEIVRLIGRGGMAAVYEARQIDLDRRVAIKLLPPELGADDAFVERFRREAKMLGRLRHPNILAVYEFGQSAADHLFFSMEYVEGGDLANRLKQGPLSPAEALRLTQEICAALQAAHAQGLVHRDIKPSNILLTEDGTVKVADFGLAVLTDPAEERLTLTGGTVGTFEYAAPEQAEGGPVDSRSDLFSLGVLCYELLTGRLPRGAFVPPSQVNAAVNPAVDSVVLTAVQSEPSRRFQSAGDFQTALTNSANAPAAAGRFTRRRFLLGAGGSLVLAVGGFGWWRSRANRNGLLMGADGQIAFWGANDAAEGNIPPIVLRVTALVAGWQHNMALLEDGRVVAWGLNLDGQNNVPTDLGPIRGVAAGSNFSAAIRADGTVVAWGNNRGGQTTVPKGLREVKAIAAGSWHALALREDGTVVAWGDNRFKQAEIPPGLKNVRAITAGNAHSLALLKDGTVVGWGENIHGQSQAPADLRDVQSVAAGGFHNIALKSDGSVVVWGNNDAGQTILPRVDLNNIVQVAAGYRHSVVLRRDGSLTAWGWNLASQCTVPEGLKGVQSVAAGMYHSLVLIQKS